jgi:hypothetical protein
MNINTIEEAFIKEGYVSIPFSNNGVGHPIMKATIGNSGEVNFLLDTGASINLLDYEFAKELKLNQTPTGEKGVGAGGLPIDIYSIEKISLEISGQIVMFDIFFSMDFSSIKEAFAAREVSEEIHGILGYGFFKMTRCFIDYSADRIFILNE